MPPREMERADASNAPSSDVGVEKKSAESVRLTRDAMESNAPLALRPWIAAYRTVPRIDVPGTTLNLSFSIVSFLALCPAREITEEFIFPRMGWPPGHRITIDAAASAVAGVQAFMLLVGCGSCLLTQPYRPAARMADAPEWWRDAARAVLDFCTGYMAYDSFFLLVTAHRTGTELSFADYCYLGHHFATSFCMASSQLMGAGHMSMMMLMFTGEFTSPFMNLHMVLRLAIRLSCCSGPTAHATLAYVEYAYAALYCVNRIFLGPMTAAYMTYDNLFTERGRKNVHVLLTIVWLPLVWGVLIGSVPWIEESIEMLRDGLAVKYGLDYDLGDRYVLHDEL